MAKNLSFGFSAPPDLGLARPAGLDVALSHFQSLRAQPESVVRAIHYRPAIPAEYADVPRSEEHTSELQSL
jgi:hypothetical protein